MPRWFQPGSRRYRLVVAVAFGAVGFAVSLLDLRPAAAGVPTIGVLAGLVFPLTIALAWGWRYGLLSALAGGCQAMWWLWRDDGWGVLYAAPIFTVWIVWHGWWADRRRRRGDGRAWLRSAFVVELPFRAVVELGFLAAFPWLVSLNPPPWASEIARRDVPLSWVQAVAIKHAVSAYLLLLLARVALALGPVRRLLGLGVGPGQRQVGAIYAGALLLGVGLWTLDAAIDVLVYPATASFWDAMVLDPDPHDLAMRVPYLALPLAAAVLLGRLARQRETLRDRLAHQNRVLSAIRNVNQLITQETDRDALLTRACRLLVETRGFYNAWIALTDRGRPTGEHFQAGFNGRFEPMATCLARGQTPPCGRAALDRDGVVVVDEPPVRCGGCVLAHRYRGRSGLATRLEQDGEVFGWLSVSVPRRFASDEQEQDLFREVAGDLAYALRSIEAETYRESTDRVMRYIVKHDPNALAVYDDKLHYIAVSDRYLQDYDVTEREILGKHHYEVFPEMPQRWKEVHRRVLGGATERCDDDWFERPDGSITYNRWECRPWYRADGSVGGIITYTEVTTERKLAEQALRESERRLRESQKTGRIGHVEYNLRTGGVLWAPMVYELYERDPRQGPPTYEEVMALHEPEDVARLQAALTRAIDRGEGYALDLRARLPSGREATYHAIGTPLRGEDGRVERVTGTVQDVTEQRRAEQERAHLAEQYRQSQKMEAVGQLAGGVAHDFNNLLQVILGCGHLALAETGLQGSVRENLREMLAAAERARELVSQLLAFSRRQVLQMTDLDLNESVPELAQMLRRVIGAHIELSFRPGQDLGIVRADPGQIAQILTNLCINARDAMPEGGRITIETGEATIDEAYCEAHAWAQPGRYVRLSVSDTGCGMDEATRRQAFEPFFTTKDVGKGTGLGLATVYGLIKQHGGLVDLTSRLGEGTTFEIYLPVVEPDRGLEQDADDEPGVAPRGCETVLLAEDEEMVRKLTRSILERSGYTVLAAPDGVEALKVFEAHAAEIDMALLDVVMPNMGGRAVLERIRAARPDVPVLFTTGYSVDAIHKDFVLDSGLALIQKPYDREELLRRVRETIDRDGRAESG